MIIKALFTYTIVYVCVCSVVSASLQPYGLYPLSLELSRQEYWSGSSFPSAGHLPDPGIELVTPVFPALAGGFFTTEPPGKPILALGSARKRQKIKAPVPARSIFPHKGAHVNTRKQT